MFSCPMCTITNHDEGHIISVQLLWIEYSWKILEDHTIYSYSSMYLPVFFYISVILFFVWWQKIERLKSSLHLLETDDKPQNKHIIFVDSKKKGNVLIGKGWWCFMPSIKWWGGCTVTDIVFDICSPVYRYGLWFIFSVWHEKLHTTYLAFKSIL